MAKAATYDASSIKHLKGAEAIRTQMGMYLGATDTDAITHLAKEVIGNSIDEGASGHGNKICISIKNNTVTVADFGRGIPVGPHPDNPKIDTLELVATELHAGGKSSANNSGYEEGTLGVFGVGLAVVNAVSEHMQIWTFRNKKWYTQTYSCGVATSKVTKTTDVPKVQGHDQSSGTIVRFKPDFKAFDKGSILDSKAILNYIDNLSWFVWQKSKTGFNPIKFVIKINDDKPIVIERKSFGDRFQEICSQNAVDPVILDKPIEIRTKNYDVLLGWTGSGGDNDFHYAYTNSLYNPVGGTHILAVKRELKKTIDKIALKKDNFNIDTFLSGAVFIVNVRIKAPKFSSQDKQKLISKDVEPLAVEQVYPEFEAWAKKNKARIRELLARAKEIGGIIDSAKLQKSLAASVKTKSSKGAIVWPKGFVQSTTKNAHEREIFLLEGDSAGGLAKKASNRYFQEMYGLTGKIPNIFRGEDKAFNNERILGLLKVIGYDPKAKDPAANLRVGKIILMTDADDDGPLMPQTQIRLENKRKATIASLAKKEMTESFPVMGVNLNSLSLKNKFSFGSVEPSLAQGARVVSKANDIYSITVMDETIRCSGNHLWPVLFDGYIVNNEPKVIPIYTRELEVGMKLLRVPRGSTNIITTTVQAIQMETFEIARNVFCMSVPGKETFTVDLNNGEGIISYNSHIASLVLGLLYVILPKAIERGMVYLVDGPLYKFQSKKGNTLWAMSYKELLEKAGGKLDGDVERAKGWGQANPDDANFFAFNPETRKLIQATPELAKNKAEGIASIMGKDSLFRKKMLGLS